MKQHLSHLPRLTTRCGKAQGEGRSEREKENKESTKQALDRYSKAKNVLETTC